MTTGDVLVYVNGECVLGFSHQEIIELFQSIPVGSQVAVEVCRGYPLPFNLEDPNNEIHTTVAVTMPPTSKTSTTLTPSGVGGSGPVVQSKGGYARDGSGNLYDDTSGTEDSGSIFAIPVAQQLMTIRIAKGPLGFGFTIADSTYGQKVKQILDRPRCKNLAEGDILVEINGIMVKDLTHADVVQVLKTCPLDAESNIVIQRGGIP